MKKAILLILLVLTGSLMALDTFGASTAPVFSTDTTISLPSANHSLGGEMKEVPHVNMLTGQPGIPREWLMIIPAGLLGMLYIVVKKQKLDIPAIRSA
jgi:hypothetical protein